MPKGSKIKTKPTTEIDTDFGNIVIPDFDNAIFDCLPSEESEQAPLDARYTKPKVYTVAEKYVMYDNAAKLARDLRIDSSHQRAHCIVHGNFIFGDFIEAYLVENKARVKEMTISTLSLNQNNVDSMYHLMRVGRIERLNLVVSSYFYGNERHALIPYIYEHLDQWDNRFQLAVAGIHTKTVHFRTMGGKYFVIQGSANLRSNGNIEQFTIEENKELFDFYDNVYSTIIERYKTINHGVRNKDLWEQMTTKRFFNN